MGYRIGYNGPQVDNLLQKGYSYSVINNGWTKLASSDLAATNLDTLVTPGNYSTSFWQNGPIQLVTNGPINVCVTKDSSSNTLYQTIYDAGKIYIRSTTSTSFSNTWREEKNDSSLDIGAGTPINPSDNYIWIDTSADVPVIKIYKETKDEWVAISAANLAKKSVYDKNNIGKSFTTYLDEKIAEGDLVTAENTYKKHIVEGEDTGNPIHVTSEEKLKWNAGINSSEADTLINNFKKDMQSYADEKVNTSSTKINDLTTEINDQKKIMDNHMGDNTIHLTADQVTAFNNKAAGDHTHLNDGTVTVSATNLTGLIPIERLDPSVLERNYTVSSYDDLFNLTKNEVQNGDSVYINETHPSAWFVVDDSKLGEYELEKWQLSMPLSNKKWQSVCYGNNKFVAVASNSNVFAYSSDGITWTQGTLPSEQAWFSICYGNDKFVVVTRDSNVFTYSTNGITWTQGTMPSKQNWTSICYGNSKFVAITNDSNVFAYSTDGITWTQGTMPSEQNWVPICYDNGKFVIVGYNSNAFAYSTDGITWTQGTMPSKQNWTSICYGNDKFVAVASNSNVFAYSSDGITWTQGTMPNKQYWYSICYGNDKFVAVASNSNVFAYSSDGITWTQGVLPVSQINGSICYGNGKFVIVAYFITDFVYSSLNKFPTALVQYAAPTPELTWNNITNKPTTISDYGLSNTYYTADEINALYIQYKTQYDKINKSVSDITDSLLEIPEDLSTTYDTNLDRARKLNKKLDDLLHSLGLNDKMISDMMTMYTNRSIIYKSNLGIEIDFDSLTVGSTFMLGKYQVESETPWDIEWEIVHQTNDYQIAMTKQIIDLRPFDGKEPTNPDKKRKANGNSNWQYSNIKQFLNSDQENWYSAQHQYDAPPNKDNCNFHNRIYNPYDTHKGFLYYWSADEKALLKDYTFTLANNTVTDGGGSYTWTGKVWLPTYTQMGFGNNNNIAEGEAFSEFPNTVGESDSRTKSLHPNCAANNEFCKLKKYTSDKNYYYMTSSAHPDVSYSVRTVDSKGQVGNSNYALYGTRGIVPCICLPRHGKFANKHDFTKEITVKYLYLNSPTDDLPTEVVDNKPSDSIYHVDYTTNYIHTIDDDHYPAGYFITSNDKSGYWEFSGWKE